MADVTLSSIKGEPSPTAILGNVEATLGQSLSVDTASNSRQLGTVIESGALTADVLKTVVEVTSGRGRLKLVGAAQKNNTSRTVRLRLTIDGVVVWDQTRAINTATNLGLIAIGRAITTSPMAPVYERIPFNSSFKVEIASSLTESNSIGTIVVYELI